MDVTTFNENKSVKTMRGVSGLSSFFTDIFMRVSAGLCLNDSQCRTCYVVRAMTYFVNKFVIKAILCGESMCLNSIESVKFTKVIANW